MSSAWDEELAERREDVEHPSRYPALAQVTLDRVAALQGCVEAGDWISHGSGTS